MVKISPKIRCRRDHFLSCWCDWSIRPGSLTDQPFGGRPSQIQVVSQRSAGPRASTRTSEGSWFRMTGASNARNSRMAPAPPSRRMLLRIRDHCSDRSCSSCIDSGAKLTVSPPYNRLRVGEWRSLVAHLNGVQGAAGSNPVSPTSLPRDGPRAQPLSRRRAAEEGAWALVAHNDERGASVHTLEADRGEYRVDLKAAAPITSNYGEASGSFSNTQPLLEPWRRVDSQSAGRG